MKLDNFEWKITKPLGVLSEVAGKTKELNLVSYNGNPPKLDLRLWGKVDGQRAMFKGLTLTTDEAETLAELLEDYLEKEKGA